MRRTFTDLQLTILQIFESILFRLHHVCRFNGFSCCEGVIVVGGREVGEEMISELWILKMGNQVSSSLKHAFHIDPSSKKKIAKQKDTIGILSFEVANVMSKMVHLHKSLSDSEISKLKNQILKSEGILNLVSLDESRLLALALAEKLEELDCIAGVVSRLGRKCTAPALLGFEHVYGDILNGVIDVGMLGFLVKDMDAMMRKFERFVQMTSKLYGDLEMLNEMERSKNKLQQALHEESRRAFHQKLDWQIQHVNHLKSISLWDKTFDKIVELLARTVCTIYARICFVFTNFDVNHGEENPSTLNHHFQLNRAHSLPQPLKRAHCHGIAQDSNQNQRLARRKPRAHYLSPPSFALQRFSLPNLSYDFTFPCGSIPTKVFMECLSLSNNSSSKINDDSIDQGDRYSKSLGCCSPSGEFKRKEEHRSHFISSNRSQINRFSSRDIRESKLAAYSSPSTIGGSALALHYANVIIVIEKLLCYPHLVGEEARADLYQMLPSSLRSCIRRKLKACAKNVAIYDAPVAHGLKDRLDGIVGWVAPLAHNMIRWQSERNFEQQQLVMGANVLLIQTLYFADLEKTEATICELLVGLNYMCRYERQQNALLNCASGFDFVDCGAEFQS